MAMGLTSLGTPSFLRHIGNTSLTSAVFGHACPVRSLLIGGENFPSARDIRIWAGENPNLNLRLFNIYGITEVSVVFNSCTITSQQFLVLNVVGDDTGDLPNENPSEKTDRLPCEFRGPT